MKKLILALLLGCVGLARAAGEFPESNLVATGWNRTTLLSSGTIMGQRQGTIYRVLCSSGVDILNEFVQVFEQTVSSPSGGFAYNTFFPSQTVFPADVLRSTGTFGGNATNLNIIDFSPFGVITSTPYFYYGGGTVIGERPCTVYWR